MKTTNGGNQLRDGLVDLLPQQIKSLRDANGLSNNLLWIKSFDSLDGPTSIINQVLKSRRRETNMSTSSEVVSPIIA